MVSVDVYTTRTEIYPYYPGEHDPIINQCSTAFDKNTFKKYRKPLCFFASTTLPTPFPLRRVHSRILRRET